MNLLALEGHLGHGLVAWGLGGSEEAIVGDDLVAFIDLPEAASLYSVALSRARSLYTVTLPVATTLYTITLVRHHVAILHVGDTALFRGIAVRDADGALVDPDTFVVNVKPQNAAEFVLTWNVTPSTGVLDSINRTAEGLFDLQIDITSARGTGQYHYRVTTTGAKCVEEGTFKVELTTLT